MRIGTWNIQGIATKVDEIFVEIAKCRMDVVVFTEIKKKGKGTEEKQEYVHIYSGVPKEERGQSGVSVAIHKKFKRCIKSWDQISDRIIQVELEIKNRSTVVIGVYAPTNDSAADKKEAFYNSLNATLEQIGSRKEILLLGDLNGRVGQRVNDPIVGRYGEDVVNDNGERLLEACQQNDLKILNGFNQHKNIHRYTWIQPSRNLRTIIDYAITKQQSKLKITDVRVLRGPECSSNHHLLLAEVYFPYQHQPKTNDKIKKTDKRESSTIKYNLKGLFDDSTRFLYQVRLANKLSSFQLNTPDTMYENLKLLIHEAAKEALGPEEKQKANGKLAPWWNKEVEELVEVKKAAYRKWLETKSERDRSEYVEQRKITQREIRNSKNEYWDKLCDEVDRSMGNTRVNKAWKVLKTLRTNNKDAAGVSLISTNKWLDYYKDLLTEDRPGFNQVELPQEESADINEEVLEITALEIRKALQGMKNGKAPGPGGINIELIKAAPNAAIDMLANIFSKCLNGHQPPKEWRQAVISSIFKKGSRADCRNYRGISVMCSVARLYGRVLKTRVESQFRHSEEQNGFRAGRSCIDGIFTLKNLIDKRVERGRPVHLVFVDLQKAYDTVPLSKLWPSLEENGIDQPYVKAIKNLYSKTTSVIKQGTKISDSFQTTKGLRQGCSIAPLLFEIYLESALKSWRGKCHGMGLQIGDDIMYTLLFADDQVIIAGDRDDASYMLRKLQEEYEKWGLTISLTKTEYMVVGEKDEGDLDLGSCRIKNSTVFKYLGVTFSSNGNSKADINNKIAQGKRAIRQLNSVLWNRNISNRNKSTIYYSIVETICTYGAETWELTQRGKQRLRALEMDYWRRSSQISKMQHVRNDRIRDIMNVKTDIVDGIESKRLRWYGHLERMNEERWPKKVWKWIPPERRKRGRPPHSWKKDIQEAMQSRGLEDGDWWNRDFWMSRCERWQQP